MSRATASEGRADGPGPTTLAPPPHAASPVRHPEAPATGTVLGTRYDQCLGRGDGRPHGPHLQARAKAPVAGTDQIKVARAFEVNP